ncbi:helix-turn-helix domain-containing protein [Candidatus Leptofilum sp.]|uniref:helix-turn-helix domain-containing protein n=1 Tax=Candidatus Leptofilum sp. TaxID=3241576 RepID=UPI003B5AB171
MIDEAFAKVLRELRVSKGFSQESLAQEVGIHRTYVSQLERGLKSPSLKTLYKIAYVLEVPLSEIMTLIEKQQEKKD